MQRAGGGGGGRGGCLRQVEVGESHGPNLAGGPERLREK